MTSRIHIIAVIVAVALAGGSSPNKSAAGVAPTTTLLSQAAFISKADAICLEFRPQIQALSAGQDYTGLAPVAQQELDQIRALGDPAENADLIHTMLNQGDQAVNWLSQDDPNDANVNILASDTAAGQFGMRVCNYGH